MKSFTVKFFVEFGVEVLEHPKYSLDVEIRDYYICFLILKKFNATLVYALFYTRVV